MWHFFMTKLSLNIILTKKKKEILRLREIFINTHTHKYTFSNYIFQTYIFKWKTQPGNTECLKNNLKHKEQ